MKPLPGIQLAFLSARSASAGSPRPSPERRGRRPRPTLVPPGGLPPSGRSRRPSGARPPKVRELDRLLLLDILAFVVLLLALFCIKGGQ